MIFNQMEEAKIARLTGQAAEALQQYTNDMAAGGEPVYPYWAIDILQLISANCAMSTELSAGQSRSNMRPSCMPDDAVFDNAERYLALRNMPDEQVGATRIPGIAVLDGPDCNFVSGEDADRIIDAWIKVNNIRSTGTGPFARARDAIERDYAAATESARDALYR